MPTSKEYLIRGGYIMPVDPAMKDILKGDVHVADGIIVAVAENIDAPNAEIIDANHAIVMPGFIDTHWHMWNGIWKGLGRGPTEYFHLHGLIPHYTVEDHYLAVKVAALEAINAGITTCHNWAHGVRNFDDVRAEMQALADTGVRAKMGYMGVMMGKVTPREDFVQALEWIAQNGHGRLGLGMLLDEAGQSSRELTVLGRELGLRPITNHGGFMTTPDIIGPEFIFTHGAAMDLKMAGTLATMKLHLSCCPNTDPLIGVGMPPVYTCIEAGLPIDNIGFSVDVSCQAPVDPFAMLRTMVNAGRMQQIADKGLAGNLLGVAHANIDWKYSYADAIRSGTLSGANILGLSAVTGSLTPGKRADIIVIRTDSLNMLPSKNVSQVCQIVQQAGVSNVDTVLIDGIVRKRGGNLVHVDVDALVTEVAQVQTSIRTRAGFPLKDISH